MTTVNAPRELLELCYRAINGGDNQLSGMEHGQTFRELKALLDAPVPEPVAWQHRVTAGPQTGWSLWAPGRGKEWAEHYTVEVRPLYAVAPTPPAKYDDTLLPFLALMRKELHANSHKGDREGWLGMSTESALCEIEHHLSKLRHAVHSADGQLVREHAADVANCAMMLADIAGVLSRE